MYTYNSTLYLFGSGCKVQFPCSSPRTALSYKLGHLKSKQTNLYLVELGVDAFQSAQRVTDYPVIVNGLVVLHFYLASVLSCLSRFHKIFQLNQYS